MKPRHLLVTSLRSLAHHRLRSGFISLGTAAGVAALTVVVSLGASAEQRILSTVRQLFSASSILVMSGGSLLQPGPREDGPRLKLDDLEALAAALPEIELWDPLKVLAEAQVRHGGATATVRLVGGSERAERAWNRGVSRGEFFDRAAVAHASRVALVGETAARELFGSEDPLDSEVLIGNVPFKVIGILEPLGTDAHGMDRDDEVLIPISTAMRRVLNTDTISGAKLLVRDPARVEETSREVRRMLRERHALAAGQPDDFTMITPQLVQRLLAQAQRVLFLFLPLGAGLVLLAAGVVAATLALFSVNQRTAEIALRRALGARPADIARQFLLETALTTTAGGLAGALLGVAATLLVARHAGLAAFVSWPALAGALLASALVGLAAGVLPARRASLLQPAEALR